MQQQQHMQQQHMQQGTARVGPRAGSDVGSDVDVNDFSRQLEDVRRRAAALAGHPADAPALEQGMLSQAVAALMATLEDLCVAEERLRREAEERRAAGGHDGDDVSVAPGADARSDAERRRFQELFDCAPDSYFVTDAHGSIYEANRAAAALLNVPLDLLIGKPLVLFIDQGARRDFMARLRQIPTAPETLHWVLPLSPRERPRVHASITVSDIRQADGSLLGVRWQMRDVTEQRRTEDAQRFLAEAGQVLATSLDYHATLATLARLAVPRIADYCLIHEVEEGGAISQVASSHADPAKDALLHELGHLRFPDPADPRSIVATVLRTGQPALYSELPAEMVADVAADARVLHILAALRPTSLMVVPLPARGQTIGAISLATCDAQRVYDASDLALAEELAVRGALAMDNARLYRSAERASQAKSDFLAVMSHELRTPLTTVIGYAELLADEIVGPVSPLQKEQLGRIRGSGEHLLRLVEEILTFVRVEAKQERVYIEEACIADIVTSTRTLIEPLVTRKGLHLAMRVPEGDARMRTDIGKIRQILVNLLANAVKFTERGEVGLAVRPEPGRTVFEVWDTGIGIAPQHLEHIFDAFWQVEHHATRRAGGTGLGLSVVRNLVELLAGDVAVASAPGSGTRFTVTLPVPAQLAEA